MAWFLLALFLCLIFLILFLTKIPLAWSRPISTLVKEPEGPVEPTRAQQGRGSLSAPLSMWPTLPVPQSWAYSPKRKLTGLYEFLNSAVLGWWYNIFMLFKNTFICTNLVFHFIYGRKLESRFPTHSLFPPLLPSSVQVLMVQMAWRPYLLFVFVWTLRFCENICLPNSQWQTDVLTHCCDFF